MVREKNIIYRKIDLLLLEALRSVPVFDSSNIKIVAMRDGMTLFRGIVILLNEGR
jgi:hypothetical protein